MSYILDALRRAEAQRERGGVPDIHGGPQGAGALPPAGTRAGSPLMWAAVVLITLAMLLFGWWLFGPRTASREAPRDVVTVAPMPAVQPQVMAPPAPQPASPVPTPVPAPVPVPPAAVAPAVPVAPVAPNTKPPKPAAKEPKAAAPAVAARASAAAPAQRPAVAAAPTPTPAPAPAVNEPRIYTREELPGDIRGQLPQIKISGSTYSQSPSSRMLIANGQVFYENEKIAPDTTLVQIRQTSAVLSFRGFRYVVPY